MTARALSIRVTGTVQGVNYRNFTQVEATRLGVTGWVINREDGSVEAAVFGPGEALAKLVELCRAGPPAAKVEALDVLSVDRGLVTNPPADAYLF